MLWALTAAFAMSQAFRTVAAILAAPLQAEFQLSPQQLGTFAGAFHFAFGAMQLFVGIGIDLHGVRWTVLMGFPLAIVGAVLSALAPGFGTLVLGQVLIGIGCAPAFLVCTVFIARHFPAQRFTALSGAVMSLGGVGLLATGTPLAWLVEATSWRMGFWVLAGCSVAAWGLIAWRVHEPDVVAGSAVGHTPRETFGQAMLTFASLFRLPHTLGIIALSCVCYASFISLRGLWLGPLLIERHGFQPRAGRQRGARRVGGVAHRPGAVRALRSGRCRAQTLAHRLHAADGGGLRVARAGARGGVRRRDDARDRLAVGLHDPAVLGGARVVSEATSSAAHSGSSRCRCSWGSR